MARRYLLNFGLVQALHSAEEEAQESRQSLEVDRILFLTGDAPFCQHAEPQ